MEKPAPTEEELQAAFRVCRAKSWPADYAEVMKDPQRAKLVDACARGLRNSPKAKVPAPLPLSQRSLSHHWPPRRVQASDYVDRKRAAAGDLDD